MSMARVRSPEPISTRLQVEAFVEPPGHATSHHLDRKSEARKAQRRARGPVAVRPCAIGYEQRRRSISGHPGSDDFSVWEIDRTGNMSPGKTIKAADIKQEIGRASCRERV